ncbi:MAG: T9SS type A sorting domain-containing protein, partial [Flavobacteriaceae bacterium]
KALLYPNPVSNLTELQYVLEEDDVISIAVYDAKYQLVQSVVNAQTRLEGQYAQSLDLSSLTPGLYFVSVEGGSINETVKVIKK